LTRIRYAASPAPSRNFQHGGQFDNFGRDLMHVRRLARKLWLKLWLSVSLAFD
jgi:hypothetical protein